MAVFRTVCHRAATVERELDGDCKALDLIRNSSSVVVTILLEWITGLFEEGKGVHSNETCHHSVTGERF